MEIDNKRFINLREQIDITHSFCVKPLRQDVLTLDTKQYRRARYILVDPSCSGSGKILFSSIISLQILVNTN